jgi:hypothetical protein
MKWTAAIVASSFAALSMTVQAGVVIAGKNAPIGSIQLDDARKIFLGRESMIDDHDVFPIYQRVGAPPRADFDGRVLEKPSAELAGYWSRLIFTGRATSTPKEVGSDNEMKAAVNNSPGAIGYINDAAVDGSVKVLLKF